MQEVNLIVKEGTGTATPLQIAVPACVTVEEVARTGNIWAFVEKVAGLKLWGETDENGASFEPSDGVDDSHSCLMELIEEARCIIDGAPLSNEMAPHALSCGKPSSDAIPVAYWDSQVYHSMDVTGNNGKPFLMEIMDHRATQGQVYVDVAAADGLVDDMLCVTVEINRLPGSADDVQCLHLSFDGDNLAASFFKQGDRYIIRPETGVSLRDTVLPNGERGWILE